MSTTIPSTTDTDSRLLVTIAEAARRLSMKPWPVYLLVESGALPSAYVGKRRLVHVDDLAAYARQLV